MRANATTAKKSPAALAAASLPPLLLDPDARARAELSRLRADAALAREGERRAKGEALAAEAVRAAAEATCEGLAGKFAAAVSWRRNEKGKRESGGKRLGWRSKESSP